MNHDTLDLKGQHFDYNNTTSFGDYRIEIAQDSDPLNPRTDDDNLGQMLCWHPRYTLGDENDYSEPNEFFHQESGLYEDYATYALSDEQLNKCIETVEKNGVMLPLFLYDHSGITMSTSRFSGGWDTGQVGIIYISKAEIIKEYGGKYLTKALRERVELYLESDVKVYDYYLTGSVYGYNITKIDDDGEEEDIDSCWGYMGYHTDDDGYMLSVIRDAIQYDITNSSQQLEMTL